MKMGIPARDLSKTGGGTKTYIECLLTSLDDTSKQSDFEVHVLHNSQQDRGRFSEIRDTFVDVGKLRFDYVEIPRWERRSDFDVLLCPKNVVPPGLGTPTAVTVHDLGYFVGFETYDLIDTLYMRWAIRRSVRRADAVIAVSENTKSDLVDYTGINPEKITIIYEAPDESFSRTPTADQRTAVRQKYDLFEDFLLVSGGSARRKNIRGLVNAFSRADTGDSRLVITGTPSSYRPVENAIETVRNVERLGHVPQRHLEVLYHEAVATVYPSQYEGFGLPVVESMAAGTPVISSDVSSIPELVAGAGILVDSDRMEELADAIERILNDDQLRRTLSESGRERAEAFSWENTAAETVSVLRSICEQG